MRQVNLCIVLHAHLPYIRHPEVEEHGFEWWFYEATWEVYAPLLAMFDRLDKSGVPFRLTMSISPPLLAMFCDRLLNERLDRHLKRLAVLTAKERDRTEGSRFYPAAMHFYYHVRQALDVYERFGKNFANGFKYWQKSGRIELITTPATHGFLPHLQDEPASAAAQVLVGVESHRRFFGRAPLGMWLSECAFLPGHDGRPGTDDLLARAGIRYFFLDGHGITNATPRPPHGVHAPIHTPAGVVALGRDTETSKQVWSATEGYPGDGWYAEHHKDLGYFLSEEQILPFRPDRTGRIPIGLKYFRVTDKSSSYKAPYVPWMALRRAAGHGAHFVRNRASQSYGLLKSMRQDTPVIVAPYDAELFGHWWHEGPKFLEYVFRKAHEQRVPFRFATPRDVLEDRIRHEAEAAASSWGDGGYYRVWLNGTNDELAPKLARANAAMTAAVREFGRATTLTAVERRALAQMGRELLLAQSSDWPFIATTSGGIRPYAIDRVDKCLGRFWGLYQAVKDRAVSGRSLETLESDTNLFPWLTTRPWQVISARRTKGARPDRNPDSAIDLGVKPVSPFLAYVWWRFDDRPPDTVLRLRCLTPPFFEKDIPSGGPAGSWYVHRLRPGCRYRLEASLHSTILAVSEPALLPGKPIDRTGQHLRWRKLEGQHR